MADTIAPSQTILIAVARDGFRREFKRDIDLANHEEVRWLNGYASALKHIQQDRHVEAPGLVALLLDMLGEVQAENARLRNGIR